MKNRRPAAMLVVLFLAGILGVAGVNATLCAVEQLPSGTLLTSWVEATGP